MNNDSVTLREHFEKILDEKDKAYDQRFQAQESAITKAEANRDNAINKAELSIEKKSDAVYVKLTDLQEAFSKVMLRPEIEGRIQSQEEKLSRVEKILTEISSKGTGMSDLFKIIISFLVGASIIWGFIK